MKSFVTLPVRENSKCFCACAALVWLFPCVDPFVTIQVTLMCKCFLASLAPECPFFCVNPFVNLQLSLGSQGLLADVRAERPVSRVCSFMIGNVQWAIAWARQGATVPVFRLLAYLLPSNFSRKLLAPSVPAAEALYFVLNGSSSRPCGGGMPSQIRLIRLLVSPTKIYFQILTLIKITPDINGAVAKSGREIRNGNFLKYAGTNPFIKAVVTVGKPECSSHSRSTALPTQWGICWPQAHAATCLRDTLYTISCK